MSVGVLDITNLWNNATLKIDQSYIDEELTNYPVAIVLDSSNFDFTGLTGIEIHFISSSGTELSFEREYFNATEQRGVFHVKLPSTYDRFKLLTDSAIDLEDAINVWDSNYIGVWHMGSSLNDSTSNGNNGTNQSTTLVDGLIGKARQFGSGSGVLLGNIGLNTSVPFTYQALNKTNLSNEQFLVAQEYAGPNREPQLSQAGGGKFTMSLASGGIVDRALIDYSPQGDYYMTSGTYDGSNLNVFNDLGKEAEPVPTPQNNSSNWYIGKRGASGSPISWLGIIDEVRISNIARSDAWIKADYYNLIENSNFITAAKWQRCRESNLIKDTTSWKRSVAGTKDGLTWQRIR